MQRFYKLFTFLCISGLILSCTSVEYIKIGNEFPSLAETDDVQVFMSSNPAQKYEKIGLVRIRGGSLEKRIEEAKEYAREKGGNAVIAREIGALSDPATDEVVEKVGASTYETQEFSIIKLETGGTSIAKADKLEEATESEKGKGSKEQDENILSLLDLNSIPRASYSQLINNYKSLQGKMFRGTLYPKKIYKIPPALKEGTESGDRLVLLTTKSGKNNIYLIVGSDKVPSFQNKIKSGEILDFVYSPFNVYTSKAGKQPVIKFVEEVIETK
jgi:hypothetical protein